MNTPLDVLGALSKDPEMPVRRAVYSNKTATEEIRAASELAGDKQARIDTQ